MNVVERSAYIHHGGRTDGVDAPRVRMGNGAEKYRTKAMTMRATASATTTRTQTGNVSVDWRSSVRTFSPSAGASLPAAPPGSIGNIESSCASSDSTSRLNDSSSPHSSRRNSIRPALSRRNAEEKSSSILRQRSGVNWGKTASSYAARAFYGVVSGDEQ